MEMPNGSRLIVLTQMEKVMSVNVDKTLKMLVRLKSHYYVHDIFNFFMVSVMQNAQTATAHFIHKQKM